jgi:hypothetical protein
MTRPFSLASRGGWGRGFAAVRIRHGVTLRCDGVAKLLGFHQAHIGWHVANLIERPEAQLPSSRTLARTITRATITVYRPCSRAILVGPLPAATLAALATAAPGLTPAINRPGAASLNDGDTARRQR